MGDTTIEWTDETWNPVRGCSRISEGCRNCYAERLAIRLSGPGKPYEGLVKSTTTGPRWTGKLRLFPELLDAPLRWRKPRRVFVNSMSDLFHESLSDDDIDSVFAVMALARWHTFQVLTKRAERMASHLTARAFHDRLAVAVATMLERLRREAYPLLRRIHLPLPYLPLENVWLGVSVEDQPSATERIPYLLSTPAAVRFLSCEPLLGPVDLEALQVSPLCTECGEQPQASALSRSERCRCTVEGPEPVAWGGLHWVIVGGESGQAARPCRLDAVRSIVRQCREAEVAVFVKQLGAAASDPVNGLAGAALKVPPDAVALVSKRLANRKGNDPSEWPEDLRGPDGMGLREFPEVLR